MTRVSALDSIGWSVPVLEMLAILNPWRRTLAMAVSRFLSQDQIRRTSYLFGLVAPGTVCCPDL
jgi:hypothetical protein